MVSTGLWKWARRALYPNRYSKKVLFCITSLVCDILWLNETCIFGEFKLVHMTLTKKLLGIIDAMFN